MKKKTSFSRLVAGLTAFLLVLAPMPFGEMGISNGIGITASAEGSSTSDSTGENGSGEGETHDNGDENSSEEGGTSGGGEENSSEEGGTSGGEDENGSNEGENNSGNSDEPADEDSSDDSEQPSDEDEDSSDDAEVKEIWISGDELDIPDSDDLFSEYVDRAFYDDTDISAFANPNYGRQSLTNAMDREVYDLLKEEITKIANGTRSNTQITLNLNQSWSTLEDSWNQVVHALLVDLPYDFYWFDKTTSYGISGYYNAPKFSFPVAKAYAVSGTYTADTRKTSAASNAAANAKAIVDKYSGASDYSKLCGYFSTICDLVEYDHDAVDNNRDYGDPWQIIYAFDGDPTTNIVCEGYSKAFKYLCDLSTFKNSSIDSALVTGMAGGRHMWNIVSIDDVSYFVDVTNCDKGAPGYNDSYGYPDYLFLKGVRNPNATGFTAVGRNLTLKYTYDQETTEMYSSKFLTVSAKDYVSSDIKCTVNIEDDALALIVNGKLADSSSVTVNAGDKLEVYVRIKDFINKAINYSCTGAQVSTELYYSDDSTGFIDKLTLSDFDENGAELTIELVDSEWDDEILSGLIKLDVGEGVNVYPYSDSEDKPVYDDPLTSGDYYPGGQKVCITADSSALSGKFISVNGTQAVGKVNSSGVYQIDDFYLSGINGMAKISIADKGYKFNAYNGVIGYVNGRAIENGTYVENGKVIELKAIIDNYINCKLTVNGTTVAPKLDDVYHRYFIYEYTVNGTDVNAELVEEKWSDDELSKYVKLEIGDKIMVFTVDGDSEYDADQDVEEDAVLENGEYYTKGYYIEIYSGGDYAKGRNILINNKVYKLNLDKNGNYYLRYLVNCQEDTLAIEFESAVTAQVGNSRMGFDTLDEALAYIKKNGSGKDITVFLDHEMTITKLAIPKNISSFKLINRNGAKISFDMTTLAIPVDTTLEIDGDGENLKPITISVAAGKTLNYDSFIHYGGAVTVKGTNTSVLNINSYLTIGGIYTFTIGGISTFSEVNVADGVAVSVEGNVTGVKLFNGDLWLKDPTYTATITTFGKGTVRLYDHDGKNAKVTVTDVDEYLNVQLVDPNTTNFTAVESGRTILWAGSAKNFTDKVTVSNKTSSNQTLNAYLYGKEIKAEYGEAVTVVVDERSKGYPNLELALKAITDKDKDYEIILNDDITVSKLTLPKTANSIVFSGSGSLKLNMTALAIPVNTSFSTDIIGTNSKPLAITVAAGKTLEISCGTENIGAVRGANTSALYVKKSNTFDSVASFGEVTVANKAVLTVKGNVTAVKLLRGTIAFPNAKSTAAITTAEDSAVILTDNNGTAAKVTVSGVIGTLTVKFVDSDNKVISLQSGRSILIAGGKTDFTDKITVENASTSGETLNAFLYGKDIRAEYAGAITLSDGTDTKNYPNLDLAVKAVKDVSKDYTFTLNENIFASKLALPKTANSIVFSGSGSLKLNMTALAIPVNTSFSTDIIGTNSKPLAITVAAGKTLEISCGTENIGAVRGANTSALYVKKSNTFDSVASFGEVTVANKAVLTVKGNVTAVKLLRGTIAFPNAKSTAAITTAEDSAVILTDNNGTAAKVTVSGVIGTLTVKFVDSDNKVISLQSGRSILIAGGKTDFTDKITVENASTSGETLNAFLYGKDIRAEYAGAITLSDGTDTKNYPNLDLAVKAVNDVSKDYTFTLNENIFTSKLTLPKTANSITFDGTGSLNLNMTALTLPVNTTFRTELVGKNAKPLAITVAAGKTLDLSDVLNIGAVKGSKTSVLNINNYASIGGISTFGEVNVADKVAVSVEGNVTAVTHYNGALWLKNPKYTANITNFGTGEVVLYDIGGKIAKVTVSNVDANGELKVKITDNLFNTLDLAGGRTLLYAGGKDDFTDRITIENTSTTAKKLTAYLYGREIRAEYAEAVTVYNDEIEIGNYPNLDLAFKAIGNSKGEYTVTLNDGIAVSKLTLPKNADSIKFDGKGSLDLNMTALSIPTNTVFCVPVNGTNAKPLAITVAAGKNLVFDENGFVSNIGAVKGGKNSVFSNKEENTVDSIASITNLMAYEPLTVTGNVTGVTYFEGKFKLPNAKSTFTATYFVGDASIGLVDNNGSFAKVTTSGVGSLDKYLDITVLDGNGSAITLPSGKTVLYSSAKYDITNYIRITNKTSANNDLTAKPYGKEIKAVNTEAVSLKADGNKIGSFATLEEAFAAMNESKKYVLTINDDLYVTKFVFPTKAVFVYIGGSGNTLFLSNISAITVNCDITFENITISNTKAYTLTAKKNLTLYNVTSDCLTAIKGTSSHIYDERENNLTFTGKNGTESTKITGFQNTAKK